MTLKPAWIIAVIQIWLVGQIVANICEMAWFGNVAQLNAFLTAPVWETQNLVTAVFSGFSVGWNYISALWNMFWWNYAFFTGAWVIAKLFLMAITGGIAFSIIMSLKR